MASIDSPKPPAAPMPASVQSKPRGAETRTTSTAFVSDANTGGTGTAKAADGTMTLTPSANAHVSVVFVGGRWRPLREPPVFADHPVQSDRAKPSRQPVEMRL